MTNEKLRKSIELKERIDDLKISYTDVCDSRRELELNEYRALTNIVRIKVDRKECNINLNRLIIFLNKEADLLKEKIDLLEVEFKEL